MPAQFNPNYFQSAPPPSFDESAVAQATLARQAQQVAAMQALGQLAQENQRITLARDEIVRKTQEDASLAQYRDATLSQGAEQLAMQERIANMAEAGQTTRQGMQGDTQREVAGMDIMGRKELQGMSDKSAMERAQLQEKGQTGRAVMGMFDSAADRKSREGMTRFEAASRERMAGDALTQRAYESGQEIASRERMQGAANDASLAGIQMQVEGRQATAQDKWASRPFHWDGKEETLPAGETAQRAWSRRKAYMDLSQLEQYKGQGPTQDAVEKYATDMIDPQLGIEPARQMSRAAASAQAGDEADQWAESEGKNRGEPVTPKEHFEFYEKRMAELGGGQVEQPALSGDSQGSSASKSPEEQIAEMAASPLLSQQRKAARMKSELDATNAMQQEAAGEAAAAYERVGGKKAPKSREAWIQAVDELGSRDKPGDADDAERDALEKVARANGWKMPETKDDWDAVLEVLRSKTPKD